MFKQCGQLSGHPNWSVLLAPGWCFPKQTGISDEAFPCGRHRSSCILWVRAFGSWKLGAVLEINFTAGARALDTIAWRGRACQTVCKSRRGMGGKWVSGCGGKLKCVRRLHRSWTTRNSAKEMEGSEATGRKQKPTLWLRRDAPGLRPRPMSLDSAEERLTHDCMGQTKCLRWGQNLQESVGMSEAESCTDTRDTPRPAGRLDRHQHSPRSARKRRTASWTAGGAL